MSTKYDQMKQVRDEVLELSVSPLYKFRIENKNFPVIGEGDHDSPLVFVGEAPGKNEAETGRPFCGRSGQVLDELLNSIEVSREKVYITNIVKDRPPQNRDPSPQEIEIYGPFLDRQIEIIKPKVIATLGRFSMAYLMNRYGLADSIESISVNHGKIFEGKTSFGIVYIIPLYHPAVAVYNARMLPVLKEDFAVLKTYLGQARKDL